MVVSPFLSRTWIRLWRISIIKWADYAKAADLYEELWEKNKNYAGYYTSLYSCLLILKEYDRLESIVKKQIKKNKSEARYKVDLGYLYKQNAKVEEGEETV